MSSTKTKADLLARIEEEREYWQRLVAKVDQAWMEEPGPMGDWSFKDLAAHITGWRERTIARFEAAGRGDEVPPPAWPAHLTEDDEINNWIYRQSKDRPLREVLQEADASYQRLATAISSLSEDDVTTPGRFPVFGGQALVDVDSLLFDHLREEHEPAIHAWLATRQG
ncbi:MAG: ClbS/DfsB family four-helix bundle protein [Thermomicrobiales bacterium]